MAHVVVSMNRDDGTMSHRFLCQPANRLSHIDPPTVWNKSWVFAIAPVIVPEWHLLKLLGMTIVSDVLSGDRAGFDE